MEKKVLMNEILALLNKVNRQAQILVHLPNMARIDVDLLLAQLRLVYDKTLDLQLKIETTRQEPKPEPKTIHPNPPIPEFNSQYTVHTAPKIEETFPFPEPEILKPVPPTHVPPADYEYLPPELRNTPQPSPPASTVNTSSAEQSKSIQQAYEEQIKTPKPVPPVSLVSASSAAQPKSLHEAYEEKNSDHSIAARLQYNPIHDLRSAIGINDKFLFMNQLFKGSLEQYNTAIERLNNYYNFEDAEIFLGSLKILHDWPDELPAIERLLHFVKRRFQQE